MSERVSMEIYKKLSHIETELSDLKQYLVKHSTTLDSVSCNKTSNEDV